MVGVRDETIVGANDALRPAMEMARQLSGRDVPVLITGETGTGKELIADAIQRVSTPAPGPPYAKVNCGAIPGSLIDRELFGHEKGAFTVAIGDRPGHFEQARGGTVFKRATEWLPDFLAGLFSGISGIAPLNE